MKRIQNLCLACGKTTSHTSYCEEDVIEYKGVSVEYTDKGYICDVCGEIYTPPDMYEDIMRELEEAYLAKIS